MREYGKVVHTHLEELRSTGLEMQKMRELFKGEVGTLTHSFNEYKAEFHQIIQQKEDSIKPEQLSALKEREEKIDNAFESFNQYLIKYHNTLSDSYYDGMFSSVQYYAAKEYTKNYLIKNSKLLDATDISNNSSILEKLALNLVHEFSLCEAQAKKLVKDEYSKLINEKNFNE